MAIQSPVLSEEDAERQRRAKAERDAIAAGTKTIPSGQAPDAVATPMEGTITQDADIAKVGPVDNITTPTAVAPTVVSTTQASATTAEAAPTTTAATITAEQTAAMAPTGTSPKLTNLPVVGQPITQEAAMQIYNEAKAKGMSAAQVSAQTGQSVEEVNKWISSSGLQALSETDAFQRGVQGELSAGAIAGPVAAPTLSEGATAQAVQITQDDIPTGAMVEAVVGQMNPEDFAEAAKVAGVEAARVDQAKQQLRKAGLTEEQIAQMANDPNALEMRLSDFTEEQRGMIGGLPVEALVSTQMDALLQGIDSGEVPAWAKPALSAVEQMLARRGMSASSIGRDALLNAVIQSALPIAQQNAQAIQGSIMQQRDLLQQGKLAEAQFKQQTALQNAQNSFNMNIRNLDARQQAAIENSRFMQTVTLTNANNRQQAALQNATAMASLDLATLDANTKLVAQNAQSFLQMDLSNLTNAQQALLVDTQFEQQRLLSNTAATNAAKQFNAASENQTTQFMQSLAATISQFNAQQINAMEQFNATEKNRQAAINSGNQLAAEQFNTQLLAQVSQFNAQQELTVEQWNAANKQAIEQSNVQWRRQANTADTAAQNAINQQNVQNTFAMTMAAMSSLWQELRDQATFDQQSYESKEDREAQLYATAIGNEAAAQNNYEHTNHLVNLAKSFFGRE